jgi:hypothetical protein
MSRILLLVLAAAGISAQTVEDLAKPTAVLTADAVRQLETKVAENPADKAAQALLGKNYAFFVLGISELGKFDRVAALDKEKAASETAQRARRQLSSSPLATVCGEGGHAIWKLATDAMVFQELHGQRGLIDVDAASLLGRQAIDHAIAIDPAEPAWREYRIYLAPQSSTLTHKTEPDPAAAYAQVKTDLAVLSGIRRQGHLPAVAKLALKAGAPEDARAYAREALDAAREPKNWNSGNLIFFGNMVLGQLALRDGQKDAAKTYLLAAGATPGSPQLNSFGPNMTLAKELAEAGEKETVLKFFDLCKVFWKMDQGRLEKWSTQIAAGKVPDFGATLIY